MLPCSSTYVAAGNATSTVRDRPGVVATLTAVTSRRGKVFPVGVTRHQERNRVASLAVDMTDRRSFGAPTTVTVCCMGVVSKVAAWPGRVANR